MSGCPYTKIMNSIPFFGSKKKAEVEEEVVTSLDTEKAMKSTNIEIAECPYKSNQKEEKKSEKKDKEERDKKCPYSSNKTTKEKEDSDVEDNIPKGGCPVMNTSN